MNKFYIQFVLFLLIISLYVNNKTLATESAPGKATKIKSKNSHVTVSVYMNDNPLATESAPDIAKKIKSKDRYATVSVYMNDKPLPTEPAPGKPKKIKPKDRYATSEEIYEKNKHLLCTNPEEIKNAEKLMNEAVEHLKYHATCKKGYKAISHIVRNHMVFFKKKHQGDTDVVKATYRKKDSNRYNQVVGKLWDPDIIDLLDYNYTKRKIARVYNPNLVIIQQRFKKWLWSHEKYFYALAKKVQLSKYESIIVMTSANIIDHHPSDKEYKNTIIESANSFTTEIDSEDDIRSGKLKKTFVRLAGYLIQECQTYVGITFISSIDGNRDVYI
ncbi:fam-a protein [Plasmodium chabaudi adami]|uniref:Fam-a protein n=1 Tax=Plasmodium chabaudi adami TaxID=5826 RepID=A0A1C6WMD4_PLACE|nr:fam-a protein [Plasmodium chabaudi adami]